MERVTKNVVIRAVVAAALALVLTVGLVPGGAGAAFADDSSSLGSSGRQGESSDAAAGSTDGAAGQTSQGSQVDRKENSWRYDDGVLMFSDSDESIATLAEGDDGDAEPSFTPWSLTDEGFINSVGDVIDGALRKGIDVSEHQGWIDWARVAESGVSFVIIRCGYGDNWYDEEAGRWRQDDSYWQYNVSQCEKYGIRYGVYLYSYAENVAMAQSEAEHVLRLLEGHSPSYPVYIDFEESSVLSVLNAFEVDIPERMADMAEVFCSAIEEAGYTAGVYANLNWWNNYLTDDVFDNWDRWVAQYNTQCDYAGGDYRLWQCTSSGAIDGIDGRVDVNFEVRLPLDVEDGDWYVDSGALQYVLARDIISGYTADYFGPYDSITRGQVATILWRMAGSPDVTSRRFDDVNYDDYYGKAILWARAEGVVNGDTGTNNFRPDAAVSRQELACMLANYAREIGAQDTSSSCVKLDRMPDSSSVAGWAREAVGWALDEGLISGSLENGVRYVRPESDTWRASAAVMVTVLDRDVV